MRVCYFYAQRYERAVDKLPVGAECIYTGASRTDYWNAIRDRWDGSEDLLIVEQDIRLHETVIPELTECPGNWCLFPYFYGPNQVNWRDARFLSSLNMMDKALGCTRFSRQLQLLVSPQDILDNSVATRDICPHCEPNALCWVHIDGPVHQTFATKGVQAPHVHMPPVDHLHFMPDED